MNEAAIYCTFLLFGHLFQGRLFSHDLEEGQHYYLDTSGQLRKIVDITEPVIGINTERYEFKERFHMLTTGQLGTLQQCNLNATIDMYPFNELRLTDGSAKVNAMFQQGNLIGFEIS